jgi:hypothetical protein
MKKISPCKEVCSTCGFLNDSQVGVLKEELGLTTIIKEGIIFPCHLQLKAVTEFENLGTEVYAEEVDVFRVCRGLVESSFKSNLHRDKPEWVDLYLQLEGAMNPKVMNIEETLKYHNIKDMK